MSKIDITSFNYTANFRFNRMFFDRVKMCISFESVDFWRVDPIICLRYPFGTTCKVWRKSPPSATVIPPKGWLLSRTSWRLRSTTSTQWWCFIGTSSHIIDLTSMNSWAWIDFLVKEHIVSCNTFNGRQCIVQFCHLHTKMMQFQMM